MKSFGIDKNYTEIDFEQVTVEDLHLISGGSGGGGGLTLKEGGFAIIALAAIPGVNVGLVAFSLGLGATLLIGGAFA